MAAIKIPPRMLLDPRHLLSLGFGSGLAPKAPGTFGTLAAVLFYIPMQGLGLETYIGITVLVSLIGIPLCGYTAHALGVHDHPGIVIDEFAGYFITMIAAPAGWLWIGIGFVLFRIFDIIKPWPIHLLDKHVPDGLGIMIDDLMAGVYALICMQLLVWSGLF